AGSFRWARAYTVRDLAPVPEPIIFKERFERFLKGPAWQLITSAGQNELAADILFGERDPKSATHSPFAAAFLRGLDGDAARRRLVNTVEVCDRVITAHDLYVYLNDQLS